MSPATFTYQRGEPVTVDLVIDDAGAYSPSDLSQMTVSMRLKSAVSNLPPPKDTASVGDFTITFSAADGSEKAFWRGSLGGSNSQDLNPGSYVVDAEIKVGQQTIEVTDFVLIRINESVTPT